MKREINQSTVVILVIVIVAAIVGGAVGYVLKPAEVTPGGVTTVTTTAPGTTVTTTVPVELEPRRAYEGTTLRLLLKTGYETAAIEQFKDVFEDATGITIEYEIYDEPTMRSKFILDATTEAGTYDVAAVQYWYFAEYDKNHWLTPLDNYIATKADPWLDFEAIQEGVREMYIGEDGKTYALPTSLAGGMLNYRTDIFENYGIKVPETTDEVLAAADDITALGIPGLYAFGGRGDPTFASFGSTVGWAWAYGARVLDPETYHPTVDTPEMLQAITDLVHLYKDHGSPGQAGMGWAEISEMYRAGSVAMHFDMSGFPSVYINPEISTVADRTSTTLIKGPAGNYAQWLYSEGLGIPKDSKNKEAAWLFIQWRCSLDTYKREVKAHIRFDIPIESIYGLSLYREEAENAGAGSLIEALPKCFATIDSAYWPWIPEFVEVAEAFQSQISSAIAGEKSVADALTSAQSAIDAIMRGAGYY
jgi:ABC-type glycerol-3-phosphate transport system substrate-binding protein